jgi:hypothetical protein
VAVEAAEKQRGGSGKIGQMRRRQRGGRGVIIGLGRRGRRGDSEYGAVVKEDKPGQMNTHKP